MQSVKFYNERNKDDYSTSRGRWCKYFFDQNNQSGLMLIGETDDYFYFTISLKDGFLKDKYSLTLNDNSMLYEQFDKLLKGFKLMDVYEEGTPEKKSLCFIKGEGSIKIVFNLTSEEKVFSTIEFANLRRLGDTRFKNLITEGKRELNVDDIRDFRYQFKVRIHRMLDDLENIYSQENQTVKQN